MFYTDQKNWLLNIHNKSEEFTAWILANKNSNIRGVIPRWGLGFTSKSSISPSIVYVFPLPVYKIKQCINHVTTYNKEWII